MTTKSAAMLDCEYENQSPTKRNAISPAARNGFTFRYSTHTSSTTIPITTCLPYRLGSRKSDVTRKNELYAFPTSTAGEKNQSLCVAA